MLKQFIPVLFLIPSIALADSDYEFVRAHKTMFIVVPKKTDKCFSSVAFKESFKSSLATSLSAMNGGEPPASPPPKASTDLAPATGKNCEPPKRPQQTAMRSRRS
jgi:hypothetical protein